MKNTFKKINKIIDSSSYVSRDTKIAHLVETIEGMEKELKELLRVRRIAVLLDKHDIHPYPDEAIAWFIKKEILGEPKERQTQDET